MAGHELDRRVNAFRPDLADAALEGKVEAARFAEGMARRITAPSVPVMAAPAHDAMMVTEALYGEDVTVFESTDEGWSWVQLATDAYVGWVASGALGEPDSAPTNRVSALAALVFSAPDIKSAPLMTLPLGARISAIGEAEDKNAKYLELAPAGYLPAPYVSGITDRPADWVSIAMTFSGSPYLWGGKTFAGIDCSGLIQVALNAVGIDCPRDTDMQEAAFGEPIEMRDDLSGLERGDLVFWPGHVGIMVDSTQLLHANAHHMATETEPLQTTLERLGSKGLSPTSVRRIPGNR